MKRKNNLFERIISIENLELADAIASTGKSKQYGVIEHNKNREANILALHESLKNKTYKTSAYTSFIIYEPKEREIFRLPYYPDRIVHHAIMNILKPLFISVFTADTYCCIEGRGIHAAADALKLALKDEAGTAYCLKLDVKKYYINVDHILLKSLLRKKIKDEDLLELLDGIIDSADGLPIGNYLSVYFGNFYLTYFDYWIKQEMKVKYYFRYMDDIVILHSNKVYLHNLLSQIKIYFNTKLKLTVKSNYQVFFVEDRGIDVLGYVFRHRYVRVRKRVKKNFARMVKRRRNKASVASYKGIFKHSNGRHFIKKIL